MPKRYGHLLPNATLIPGLLLILTLGLAGGCALTSDRSSPRVDAQDNPPASAQIKTPGSVTVVDFRLDLTDAQKQIADSADQAAIIKAVYGPGVPDLFTISGRVEGAFTAAGKQQTLYMIVTRDPPAGSDVMPPMLALYENNTLVTQFVPTNASYRSFAGTSDADLDGVHEVLLVNKGYHMGTFFSVADLFSFKYGKRALVKNFDTVFKNACDAQQNDGLIRASELVLVPVDTNKEKLSWNRIDYTAPCNDGGVYPSPESYKSVDAG